jgi:hypothetical protein
LKLFGEDHPYTAHSYGNLASNQNAQGKYAEAERNGRRALELRVKLLGEEHHHTAASYNNLAKALKTHAQDKEIELRFWRNGEVHTRAAQPGKLGVVLAKDPAPKALADRRQFAKELEQARSADDGDWAQLPGTRIEAEALRRLFSAQKMDAQLLTDSQASEQALDALSRSGAVGKVRYVHLATHGLLHRQTPLRSALILSRDQLPDPDKQMAAGLPLYDGKLTAAEVLRD